MGYKLCQSGRPSPSTLEESLLSVSPLVESPSDEGRGSSAKKSGKVRLAAIPNLDDGTYEEMPTDISGTGFKGWFC